MTEISTSPAIDIQGDAKLRSPDGLTNVITTLLAPIFASLNGGALAAARVAAVEAISAYPARDPLDLLAAAQIIACGLASLDLMGRSMAEGVSLTMAMKVHAKAIALDRCAERSRRALRDSRRERATSPARSREGREDRGSAPPIARPASQAVQPIAAGRSEKGPVPAADQRQQPARSGDSKADIAARLVASLLHISPSEHKVGSVRAAAMSSCATQPFKATGTPPLGSVSLAKPGEGPIMPA